ncbi:cysteine-rich RLK (RECEPTOR-like protein kinase)18 [Striga asiatica]|uniref:Cysteine-rich RLK (RECEPTOR-like protein kinase)18 n=1 Tax=Striga asiatica TaxID=4170 RepID=A0A5A7QZ20_STRAF|nr:cysteine-rich RLK (RECEPTOR-like protein kinase)18 [Striga asiatica]
MLALVGLKAGLYSGKSRPDLYRTPHALHKVFGPKGPARHCGVFCTSQCVHLRPETQSGSALLFCFLARDFSGRENFSVLKFGRTKADKLDWSCEEDEKSTVVNGREDRAQGRRLGFLERELRALPWIGKGKRGARFCWAGWARLVGFGPGLKFLAGHNRESPDKKWKVNYRQSKSRQAVNFVGAGEIRRRVIRQFFFTKLMIFPRKTNITLLKLFFGEVQVKEVLDREIIRCDAANLSQAPNVVVLEHLRICFQQEA